LQKKIVFQGSEGNDLLHEYGVLTDSLVPPHRYVPHILIDGVHDEELQELAQTDLLKFVCELYNGEQPEECLGA
jgi:interferon gamma-inducible protein 30